MKTQPELRRFVCPKCGNWCWAPLAAGLRCNHHGSAEASVVMLPKEDEE